MSAEQRLDGEVALVVGGTRNIGLGAAMALQAAGARVCVVGRSSRDALRRSLEMLEARGEAIGMLADASDEDGGRTSRIDAGPTRAGSAVTTGCSCRATGAGSPSLGWISGLAVALIVARRRRT